MKEVSMTRWSSGSRRRGKMMTQCLIEILALVLDCGQEVHDGISSDSERRASQHDKQALCSLIDSL